jgi:polyphenol oxidase
MMIELTGWSSLNVRALVTTRDGGVSQAPFNSFNLGAHVGDNLEHVATNRRQLTQHLPNPPIWLEQVHGTVVYEITANSLADQYQGVVPVADASFTIMKGQVSAIMTADCLPVLLASRCGQVVGAVHAGWRGLRAGAVTQCIKRMRDVKPSVQLEAMFGPAIGPDCFEVGAEVRQAFVDQNQAASACFKPGAMPGKWLANLYALAAIELAQNQVTLLSLGKVSGQVYLGDRPCTVTEEDRYFSYRREGRTGRMATCVWIAS